MVLELGGSQDSRERERDKTGQEEGENREPKLIIIITTITIFTLASQGDRRYWTDRHTLGDETCDGAYTYCICVKIYT